MKMVFAVIIWLYYMCWVMNNKKINNVSFHKVVVSPKMKFLLNPFKENEEFDLSAIIIELYAHISVIVLAVLYLTGEIEKFNHNVWLIATFALLCIVEAISFKRHIGQTDNKAAKFGYGIILIVLMLAALVSVFYVAMLILDEFKVM